MQPLAQLSTPIPKPILRQHYTRDRVLRVGGFGDKIMAATHDWSKPWYVIDHSPERVIFNPDFRAPRGTWAVDRGLAAWAKGLHLEDKIMLAPFIKGRFSADNKDWGWHRWQTLAERLKGRCFHCVPPGRDALAGVPAISTQTFHHAVAALERCKVLVATDGGLHHAAAALRHPAVVIWGAFSDPAILGYPDHVNLYEPDPEGLGRRVSHPACRAAMDAITVDEVLAAVEHSAC
jgi:ADP-heptose:LPS heptosyltransferase